MREFTFKEILGHACENWQHKAQDLYDEFVEKKGRKKFTFLDVMTNSSLDDNEHDTIFVRMIGEYDPDANFDVGIFDNWLFGDGKIEPYGIGVNVYREIMYALMRTGEFEKLLNECLKQRREED